MSTLVPTPPPDPPSLRAWRWIAIQEGGGTIHTVLGDPGGTTKWGFAQRYNPDIDVTTLTFAAAYTRFVSRFWLPLMASALPYPVALALVDYAFNAGPDDSIPALQRAAGAAIDGVMGGRTINAVNTVYGHNPQRFMSNLLSYRCLKYAESPRVRDNRGWFVRTLDLRAVVEKEMSA